jgi:hypothetical protein
MYRLAAGSSFTTPLLLVSDEEEIVGGSQASEVTLFR